MARAIEKGFIHEVDGVPSIADANGGNLEENSITFDYCKSLLEEIILVEEHEIKSAVKTYLEYEKRLIEPTAALAVAGFLRKQDELKSKNVVLVTCGRNIQISTLTDILQNK